MLDKKLENAKDSKQNNGTLCSMQLSVIILFKF